MLMLTACAGNRTTQETAEVIRRGDTVIISNNSPILKQIEFTTVEPETWSAQFRTVGEVTPVAGRIAEISAPFSGRVEGCSVRLGQRVEEGTPVFALGSSDFYEAVRTYFSAKSNNELAARRYARQSGLSRNGVGRSGSLNRPGARPISQSGSWSRLPRYCVFSMLIRPLCGWGSRLRQSLR